MKLSTRMIVASFILFFSMNSFGAETAKMRHIQSIYFDEKGAGMKQPEGIACNDKSVLVVGDTGNGRLVVYNFQERTVKSGAEIKVPQLSSPIRIQINSKGDIFALDGKLRQIVRLGPQGEYKDILNVQGIPGPSGFVPRSFKIDQNDNFYILDIFSGRVLIIGPDGKYQRHIDFPARYGFFSDLAVDPKGNILLVDCATRLVFSAARDAKEFSPLGGSLREYLSFPTYITTDNRGTIYIVDENGAGVLILGQDGSFLGRQLTMGWNEGLLYYPSQMCINDKGEVFIADRGNNRVQIFNLIK